MIDLSSFKAAQLKTLDALGSPCHYVNVKSSNTLDIVAGFKTAGVRDEAIVNAYGVGAKIITVKASDFTTPPEKFDTFQFDGNNETYKADTVNPKHIGAEVVFYTIYIKGK